MDAQVLPVMGVDEGDTTTTAAYWATHATSGDLDSVGMPARRCALLAGMYAAREGQGQEDNPFLRNGRDDLIQHWLNGYFTEPRRDRQAFAAHGPEAAR